MVTDVELVMQVYPNMLFERELAWLAVVQVAGLGKLDAQDLQKVTC